MRSRFFRESGYREHILETLRRAVGELPWVGAECLKDQFLKYHTPIPNPVNYQKWIKQEGAQRLLAYAPYLPLSTLVQTTHERGMRSIRVRRYRHHVRWLMRGMQDGLQGGGNIPTLAGTRLDTSRGPSCFRSLFITEVSHFFSERHEPLQEVTNSGIFLGNLPRALVLLC